MAFARDIVVKIRFVTQPQAIQKANRAVEKLKRSLGSVASVVGPKVAAVARSIGRGFMWLGRTVKNVRWEVLGLEQQMLRLRNTVDGLVNAFRKTFIIVMSLYALGKGLGSFVAAAGQVEENLNAMSISFERNKTAVLEWADAYSKATGRSKYELREMATQFALIMKGQISDGKVVARLSMGLTERAIDMQSALQEAAGSSADVSRAIISALTGETEQIKRWGIDVRVDALKRYAKEMGLNYASMSEAAKIEIRYQKIMKDTNYLVGDAIKTRFEYTNTMKNLYGVISDLRIMMGKGMLPLVLKLSNAFILATRSLIDFMEKGNEAEAILTTIGILIGLLALKFAITFAPLLLTIALIGYGFWKLKGQIEDFIGFMKGDESVFGRWAADAGVLKEDLVLIGRSIMYIAKGTLLMVKALVLLEKYMGRYVGEGIAKTADVISREVGRQQTYWDMKSKLDSGDISKDTFNRFVRSQGNSRANDAMRFEFIFSGLDRDRDKNFRDRAQRGATKFAKELMGTGESNEWDEEMTYSVQFSAGE